MRTPTVQVPGGEGKSRGGAPSPSQGHRVCWSRLASPWVSSGKWAQGKRPLTDGKDGETFCTVS